MRNPILRSATIVFVFWWLVSVAWGVKTYGFPDSSVFLLKAIKAFGWGIIAFIFAIVVSASLRWARRGWHLPTEERGIHCTIGIVPGLLIWPRCRKPCRVDLARWPRVAEWMTQGQAEYVAVFQAILDVMGARPHFPASPTKGGHGDATLLEHSLNVAETGLELFSSWRFSRKSGDMMLQDRALTPQDRDIALLILIGHDIGKLEAFKVDGDRVSIEKRFHDREGGRILATLKEVWALPEDDRKALIAAVTHEHHPQDLPTHTGDNVRLLLEFLIDADREAGRREEGRAAIEEPEQTDCQTDEALWEWFLDYLSKPGTINGREQRFRAGFKAADGCLYLNEPNVRAACAEQFFKNPLQAEVQLGDGRYRITQELLRILNAHGVLICEFEKQRFSYKNALFKVVSSNSQGRVLGEWQVAFVVALGEYMPSGLRTLDPAPNPPQIVQALYGTRALRSSADDGSESEPSPPSTTPSSASAEPVADPSTANAVPSESPNEPPVDPYAHLGGLGQALLRGLRQQGREPTEDSNGCLTLTPTEAAEFSLKGGVPHKGYFDAFLKVVQADEAVMRGVEIISDEAGVIQSVRVCLHRDPPAPSPAETASTSSANVMADPVLETTPAVPGEPQTSGIDAPPPSGILEIDAWSTPAPESMPSSPTGIEASPIPTAVEVPVVEASPTAFHPVEVTPPLPAGLDAFEIAGLDSFDFGGEGLEQLNEQVKADRKNRNKRRTRASKTVVSSIVAQLNDRIY